MITGKKVKLREKKLSDAPDDYGWQTDPELALLDAAPILTTPFTRYLSEHARELSYPSFTRQQFAIETKSGKHIGNCTYYAIDETKGDAELGIMIGNRDYWDKGYGTDTVNTLVDHIFRNTELKRVYLKTLNSNARAQKCFKKCGFTPYGRMDKNGHSFLLMEIKRAQWQKKPVKT
jgi:RimJ/RimL family protein N-acetyltransferase